MKENRLENRLELAQDLLDSGLSYGKVAGMIGESKQVVRYWVKTGKIEKYDAFDEVGDRKHLYQNFEWLWEEDKIEEMLKKAYDSKLTIDRREGDLFPIYKYLTTKYFGIKNYLKIKGLSPLEDFIFVVCSTCNKELPLNDYHLHGKGLLGIDYSCKKCKKDYLQDNKEVITVISERRRSRKVALPDTWKEYEMSDTWGIFENKCALTGSSRNISAEHSIPLKIGHGGTYQGNLYPLTKSLNSSKRSRNIFEWFASVRQRFELSQERFDKLIDYLASANALTVEEYRDFVYWCHDNPRNIDEIKRDQRHSIEIWREAVGKQFPLPSYATSYENTKVSEIGNRSA